MITSSLYLSACLTLPVTTAKLPPGYVGRYATRSPARSPATATEPASTTTATDGSSRLARCHALVAPSATTIATAGYRYASVRPVPSGTRDGIDRTRVGPVAAGQGSEPRHAARRP